jgi:hypothetical protein
MEEKTTPTEDDWANLRQARPDSVEEFIEKLPEYFTICVASRRNSGKTVLITAVIKALLKAKRVDIVLAMSNSAALNGDYGFLPKKLVMPFKEATLEALWERQKKAPEKKREHVLVVLDDVLSDKNALRCEIIQRIYSLGRHCHISCILISQVANYVLDPLTKQNSDMILWSRLNPYQLGVLWESINGVEKRWFVRWSESLGGHEYNFCYFNCYSQSNDPEEFLGAVRAEPPPGKKKNREEPEKKSVE